MDAAAKYENRYRAVIEYANGAMFNVAELDAWAASNKVPISFQKLLVDDGVKDGYDSTRHYVSFEILSITIASAIVPEDADPNDARVQLMAAHDTAEPDDPVSRLRDLVMVRYDRLLLSAIYDGDLNLFDTLMYGKIDVSAAKLRYEADPEAYVQAAQARITDTAHGAITAADIEQAKNTLSQKFARLDHLAWAIVILTADAPPPGEDRYRQILSTTRWLQALSLPFRHSNGLPASQPKGVPVTGMDVREYQYLAVADVRTAAIEARCWPTEEKETPPMPPISDFAPRSVRLPNASMVNVEWLVREIAFALAPIPDDKRLATLTKETPNGPDRWNIEPLTGDDWRLIREICGSKPPAPCSPAQFEAWRAPFDTAPNKPDWALRPEFKPSNEMQAAQSRWSLVNVQHLQQIRQKAERKELPLITPAGIETSDIYDNAGLAVGCLRIADAKAYLDQCCIAWDVASVADLAPSATNPNKGMTHDKPNWGVWNYMHKVSLRDAVCLSYDVAPGAATLNPIENGIAHLLGLNFVGWDVSRKISERLSIARSHAGTGGTLSTVTGDKDGEVYLATFAEWAVNTMEWSVPDELRTIASRVQPVDESEATGADTQAISTSKPEAAPSQGVREISKAPPPIEPLTGGSHSHRLAYSKPKPESRVIGSGKPLLSHLERKPPRPPRWDDWRLMPELEVWQAVALSLDIEPDEVRFNRDAWMGAEFPFDEGDDFTRRLRITLANLSDRTRFPTPGAINIGVPHRNGVRLGEFERFAVEIARWEVPDEFRALAGSTHAAVAQATAMSSQLEPTKAAARRPLKQQAHQEAEILRVIRELNHDPKKLPKQKPGKPGVKAAVREKLTFSKKVFDKAWDRLRASGDVADNEHSPKLG
ncbi:hypothetical protein [Burkholderia pseudomallei]|uniref:hypothetical protein n=1 Tax=Burkholderia pseudomallei TaxID=28450 RepID=UPI001E61B1E8|nr:hypothetical protein [Burkholderia pseudomallei]